MSEYAREEDVHFIKIHLTPKDSWVGKEIQNIGLPRGVIVAAIQRGADVVVPRGNVIMLSGDTVVYGDEQREKQAHVMTHHIYLPTLARGESDMEGYYCADLRGLLNLYYEALPEDKPNNLFVTTMALRDYHYTKHKNNGFYHIRALNLPFQNIEFYYVNCRGLLADG
jgi:hypothetical protein